MGFRADAQEEFALAERILRSRALDPLALARLLARLYHEAGFYGEAIRVLNEPFSRMAPEEVLSLDGGFWRLYYPRPFLEAIERESLKHGLEPSLVLGLIRQESAFRTDARSPAGALGLMQLLPSRGPVGQEELMELKVNLALGTAHLAELIRRYEGSLAEALAAYNAGVHRLERWKRRFQGMEEDEFIEAIPFAETRTYVKRVLRNKALYEMLYASR